MNRWISGVLGAVVVAGAAVPAVAAGSEADLAYHGFVAMGRGEVNVRLTPSNHGPSDIEDATVRLHWSKPLANQQQQPLSEGCARYDASTVLCRTGSIAAGGAGKEIHVRVRLANTSTDEVRLEIESLWGGGAVDRNPGNDRQQVLALDTGDRYNF
ncbi:hypothetical protein ABT173_22835 [Streptomyces sp. NPDC001795]|uniref:hypothetical protein n=1 Tax=unclassified Streptomyces TaxID=2593676 RepID=UPI00331AEC83